MPILWRYLLLGYLRIFLLSVCSFIGILLVSRVKEIARFAALSANLEKTFLFVAYQIPLILPLALPISAFIASILLFQKLSKSHELTALRASGMRLSTIVAPILMMSIVLSLFNFMVSVDLTPYCRRSSKELLYYETSTNPLLLLQRQNLAKMKKSYIKMKLDDEGMSAKDLFLITHNQSNHRLSLLTAKKLRVDKTELLGTDVALITHLDSKDQMFDPLIVENQSWLSTDASTLSSGLKKNRPRLEASSLELPLLRLHNMEGGTKKNFCELLRRLSLSLAVFSFTLLGCMYGIEQARSLSKVGLFKAIGLALTLMMSYLLGKEFKTPLIAFAIFFLPHPLIWIASIRKAVKT